LTDRSAVAAAGGSESVALDDEAPRRGRYEGHGVPGVGGALRRGLVDFYYHSIRLVGANLAWGLGLVAVLFVVAGAGYLPGVVIAAPLGVAWLGIVRLATLIVRGHDVVLSDALRAWRRWLVPGLVSGAAIAATALVLGFNVTIGLAMGGVVGWTLTALAAWGLVFLWLLALAFWPLLVDPARDAGGPRSAARLAALLVLAHPVRLGGLGIVLAILAAVSTAAIAAILSISAAYIALATSHLVLPAADQLEAGLRARDGAPERP
jgi:hypothetical protein